jgi:YVTN family beta-propeller protein
MRCSDLELLIRRLRQPTIVYSLLENTILVCYETRTPQDDEHFRYQTGSFTNLRSKVNPPVMIGRQIERPFPLSWRLIVQMLSRWARFVLLLVLFVAFVSLAWQPACALAESAARDLQAPADTRPTHISRSGVTIIPSGRFITPRGVQVNVAPHPYGLALSPDGRTLVTVNSGTAPFSISIITQLASARPQVAQIPRGFKPSDADPKSVYLGAAIAPDNRTAFISEGNNGKVGIFDLVARRRLGSLTLDRAFQGKTFHDSLPGDLKLSSDGRYLYVLDVAHFRLVIFNTESRQMIASVAVGLLPFGIALSPDGKNLYVSNAGMFRYSLVPGFNPKDTMRTGLTFPPFGFPSKQAEEGTTIDGEKIPGLGSPNTPASNSLWVMNVSDPTRPHVTLKIPTGIPVGPLSVGGSSPCGVVASRRYIYVSNASQDSITMIDARTGRVKRTVLLEPAASVKGLRGVLPFGLALSPDDKRLYVACAGINAVAVLDARTVSVQGYVPTGWFPARVAVSADGSILYVANGKGFGAGPNGGPNFHEGPEGDYIGDITKGTVSIIRLHALSVPGEVWTISQRAQSAPGSPRDETNQVMANNGFIPSAVRDRRASDFPIPPPGTASREIRHVVFIIKENRTFDQVLGDMKEVGGETVNGDANLAGFGDHACVENKDLGTSFTNVRVSPNHHALATRFGISDNFYVDGDVSVDGHHWLVGNYPTEVLETAWPAGYGGEFDWKPDPNAPGRLEIGSTSPWPEDYLEAGSLWEHLARHHISFRNYGEGLELSGYDEEADMEPTGVREAVNVPMPEPLFENTSRIYPDFNTDISDQYRFQQFMREWRERYQSGREPLPQFISMWLPQDHTDKPHPSEGYPFRASYVADNDLALGKLVQVFSHSRYWRHMAIFVTEDDAQSGTDHVDAHRSILLVISPYSRRGVSHVHTDFMSILKTFDLIFGLPYLNQYDAAATDLFSRFTAVPDFTPYSALPSDRRVFDPAKVAENGLEHATEPPSAPLDDPATIRQEMEKQDGERTAGCPR